MLVDNLKIFNNYVNKFDLSDTNIARKFYHSLRVSDNSFNIANSLNLNENDKNLTKFIGLTHDIGRFLQWKIYETFEDRKSIDHALLSVQILFDKNIGFLIAKDDQQIVQRAIFNHNKYKLAEFLNERELLFAKILRDADKLDLLYLLGKKEIVLDEDNSEVTDVISEKFWKCQEINTLDCRTLTDKILFKMAFVFDLNFKWSFERLEKEKLLDNFYNNLKYKNKYKKYYWHVKEYIASKKISL